MEGEMKQHTTGVIGTLILVGLILVAASLARRPSTPLGSDGAHAEVPTSTTSAPDIAAGPAATATQVADSARGRAVFASQGCGDCHSAAGAGGGRIGLDGVGARRSRAELRAWTTGEGAAAGELPPATVRRKQEYLRMPAADLEALISFLASLRRS
jgi:mono/diheme cytochrome c family protein